MKSWERVAAIIVTSLAILSAVQSVARLPFRLEQNEKEATALRIEFQIEKAKSQENKETMIRMEEQLKAIRQMVETMYRQRPSQQTN